MTKFGKIPTYDIVNGQKVKGTNLYHNYLIPGNKNVAGSVTIAEHGRFFERTLIGEVYPKTRSSVVFHELSENYYRVNGQGYFDAHNGAIEAEKKFSTDDVRRSKRPGVGEYQK